MGSEWSLAYRVIDAQYFGVAQRRRRIYLVADFNGKCASQVLFEPEGMRRHFTPRFNSWKGAARYLKVSTQDTSEMILDDQGGNRMDISFDKVNTLRAEAHHPPCVMQEDLSIENKPSDSRLHINADGKTQTLTAQMGTGGNNVPLTLKIRSGCDGGGKGALVQVDKSATLTVQNEQSLFEPVTYRISSFKSHAMLSGNPICGHAETDTARTLDENGGNPACHQGGIAVCVHSMTSGMFMESYEEKAATLTARDYKSPQSIGCGYIVRRLMPEECARLQGFPGGWCDGLGSDNPSDDEVLFFKNVLDTFNMDVISLW